MRRMGWVRYLLSGPTRDWLCPLRLVERRRLLPDLPDPPAFAVRPLGYSSHLRIYLPHFPFRDLHCNLHHHSVQRLRTSLRGAGTWGSLVSA